MASELKPCAHCNGAAELDYEQTFCAFPSGKMEKQVAIYCTVCDVHMSMCYSDFPEYDHDQMAAILTEKWNTRPAPAEDEVTIPRNPTEAMMDAGLYHCSHDMEWSDLFTAWQAMFDAVTLDGGMTEHAKASPASAATDTGLVTMGYMAQTRMGWIPSCASSGGEAVVTRSQAGELLAAERAKVRHWQEQYTEMHSQFIDLAKSAEADNAAKDARIKYLEDAIKAKGGNEHSPTQDAYDLACKAIEKHRNRAEALEAKLAAAEQTARAAHETLIEINPSNYSHDDVCQLNDASVEAIFLLADIIGETHGKTKEWWDERRAALGGKP